MNFIDNLNLIPNKINFLLKKIILGDLDNVVMNLAIFCGKELDYETNKIKFEIIDHEFENIHN